MSPQTVNFFSFDNGDAPEVIADADHEGFESIETRTGSRGMGKALLIEGRYYVLHPSCPDEGMAAWSATQSPVDAAKEAVLSAMTAEQRAAIGFSDWMPYAQRVAKKQADDVAAKAKADAAKPAKGSPK